ncbi:hypothetical protein BV372_21425 [Nostoc sp. T09]|nr:hypothetical protein BV372_21425 [Nostoc sp. T09]
MPNWQKWTGEQQGTGFEDNGHMKTEASCGSSKEFGAAAMANPNFKKVSSPRSKVLKTIRLLNLVIFTCHSPQAGEPVQGDGS